MKSKKDMSAFATSILKTFATNPFQPLNYKQIASRLGITDKGSKEMIKNHLQQMQGFLQSPEKPSAYDAGYQECVDVACEVICRSG